MRRRLLGFFFEILRCNFSKGNQSLREERRRINRLFFERKGRRLLVFFEILRCNFSKGNQCFAKRIEESIVHFLSGWETLVGFFEILRCNFSKGNQRFAKRIEESIVHFFERKGRRLLVFFEILRCNFSKEEQSLREERRSKRGCWVYSCFAK